MPDESTIHKLFEQLIEKMERQSTNSAHQSFGSLSYHLERAKLGLDEQKYLDPLYDVELPRWLGEYGNTPLEDEIFNVSIEINQEATRLSGGQDVVNAARQTHNNKQRVQDD